MKKSIYIIIAVLLFTSCDDYLDTKPNKNNQEVEYVSDIDLLMNKTYYGYLTDVSFSNITGDVHFQKDVYGKLGNWIPLTNVQASIWKDKLSSVNDENFSQAYATIWFANFVINSIDGMEGDNDEKANLKAEAYLMKAYMQFNLALKHCLYPSDKNSQELGIPLKDQTSFGNQTVRASIEETFTKIEDDIKEGLKINKPRTVSWRESNASAAAFAARYYLYVNDFVNAKKYAEKAVSLHSTMINIENDIDLVDQYGTSLTAKTATVYPYLKEFYTNWESQYKIYYDQTTGYKFVSDDLLAAYEPNDLRIKYFYSDAVCATFYGLDDKMMYGKTGELVTGTDVAEMYLIIAECAARNNDFITCMQNVEIVRVNRFAAADYSVLPIPSTVKESIELVANERWREFPFTSLRWYDVKRLNNEGLIDPIILSKDYFEVGESAIDFDSPKTYTLEPNSRKYARPLPQELILLTGGSVEQNTY